MSTYRLVTQVYYFIVGPPAKPHAPKSTILITGVGSGLGYETAKQLALEHNVIGLYAHSIDVPKLTKIGITPLPYWDYKEKLPQNIDLCILNAAKISDDTREMLDCNYTQQKNIYNLLNTRTICVLDDMVFEPKYGSVIQNYLSTKRLLLHMTMIKGGCGFYPGPMYTQLYRNYIWIRRVLWWTNSPGVVADQLVYLANLALVQNLKGRIYTGYANFV